MLLTCCASEYLYALCDSLNTAQVFVPMYQRAGVPGNTEVTMCDMRTTAWAFVFAMLLQGLFLLQELLVVGRR